jgi:hypothetical protein
MVATHDATYGIRGLLDAGSKDEAWMLAAQEIACATHTAFPAAMSHVTLVQRVADSLGCAWEALDLGEITLGHLNALERVTRNCTPRVCAAVDAKVIPLSIERGWTAGELSRAARRMVIALDPEGAKDRAGKAKDHADVQLFPGEDETATLSATGDATKNLAMMDLINDHAEAMARAGDQRTVGVRRFDALYQLLCGAASGALGVVDDDGVIRPRPTTPARGTALVGIDLATLLGLNEHPGELAGYGPITADTARALASESMLRRMITDPITGQAIDLAQNGYRPTAALRRLIQATYPTCTMPGCSRPSATCEIDHRHEHHNGGATARGNLKPLCKMHHQLKTKERWRVDVNPDGSETWTSYLGKTYTKKSVWFPLPEPLDDERPPEHIEDRLPRVADPSPLRPDDPLPEPPPLTEIEYEQMHHALDLLHAYGETFTTWCDRYYDEARGTGLVA